MVHLRRLERLIRDRVGLLVIAIEPDALEKLIAVARAAKAYIDSRKANLSEERIALRAVLAEVTDD